MHFIHTLTKRQVLILWIAATAVAFGQSTAPSEITVDGVHIKGVPTDWSHRHVIFSNPGTEAEAIQNGTHDRWLKIANGPRYVIQQLQRRQPGQGPTAVQVAGLMAAEPTTSTSPEGAVPESPDQKRQRRHRDWSIDLGTGGLALNGYPAKWSFSTTIANCASDFVVFPTGTSGSSSQATVVAYNNLYAGCGGTVPSVYWKYNTGTNSETGASPVLSADGSQLAFVQTGSTTSLVILKWAANSSLVTLSNTPAASYRACSAPCMTTLTPANNGFSSTSSPFYDYANDVIYVCDGNGGLHKFTGVFNGTPTEAGSPWPVVIASGASLTNPVLDSVSGRITVGTWSGTLMGHLFSVDSSTGANPGTSSQLGPYGIYDAPLVDSSAATTYAFVGDNGTTVSRTATVTADAAAYFQFPVTFTSGAGTETQVGTGSYPMFSGAFDNAYYNSNASTPSGHLYVCGQTNYSDAQTLNQISISSNVMGSETASSYLVGDEAYCSPVTEFYNTNTSTDYIFLSSEGAYQGCTQGSGCLFGFNVTTGTVPDSAEFGASTGGTSGIIVDNSVGSGTLAGASQIYFATLASGTCATSGGTGKCGVQDSQTSLYVDWSQFHFTPDHDGFNQYENLLSSSTVGGLGVVWSYTTGNELESSPAVVNGLVYVGSFDDKVYALNASTGAQLWSYTANSSVASSPAVANGVVYFGSFGDNDLRPERLNRRPAMELHHRQCCGFLARRGEWGGLCRLATTTTCTR